MNTRSFVTSLSVRRGDTARRICISLAENGMPYTIARGCYAIFEGKKPDESILFNDCVISGNTIIYDITEQTTAVAGRISCAIRLYGADGRLITSPPFDIVVRDTLIEDEKVESSDEFSALTALVSEVQALKDGSASKVTEVDLLAAAWEGEDSPYSQVVAIDGVSANSMVDLLPSVEQLEIFHQKDLAFVAENEGGVVTVYAIGDKPTADYTMQVVVTEVTV